MLKELLYDFSHVKQRSYQPDTFQPYFSMILIVIISTIFAYAFQITTTSIHTNNLPISNNNVQIDLCSSFPTYSLRYICPDMQKNNLNLHSYNSNFLLTFEQDLHKLIN